MNVYGFPKMNVSVGPVGPVAPLGPVGPVAPVGQQGGQQQCGGLRLQEACSG